MKFKKILVILLSFILIFMFLQTVSLADNTTAVDASVTSIKTTMQGVKDGSNDVGKIEGVINIVIGLLQVGGTGVALIVITMLGIKYILASPSEKADVKKQIMPIIIGCILLFGAMQLMVAVYKFSNDVLQ